MKKIRLFVIMILFAGLTGLASCGQGPGEKAQDKEENAGVENMEQDTEEKTQQMIEKAEKLEGEAESDTASR
jgi:predicted small lipoprotein YifL